MTRYSAAQLLRSHGLRPKRRLSQSFLRDDGICRRIAGAVTAGQPATVLEIGAGLGALTRQLLAGGAKVVAVERDSELVTVLNELWPDEPRLRVVAADATRLDWLGELGSFGDPPYVIAGNLPYAITGKLIEQAVAVAAHVDRALFMVQREVADRLCAQPSCRAYGVLTVFVQAAYAVERLAQVGRGAFVPQPAVDSTVLRLCPHRPARAEETAELREVVKTAFAMRRKTLRNAWRALGLSQAELERLAARVAIDLDARAETLDVEAFARMAACLSRSRERSGA